MTTSHQPNECVEQFIAVYQNMLLRQRKFPRRAFRSGGRPWLYMAAGANCCEILKLKPERYLGILFWHYCELLERRPPTPRMVGGQEALRIVRTFLEQASGVKTGSAEDFDLVSSIIPSKVPRAGGLP